MIALTTTPVSSPVFGGARTGRQMLWSGLAEVQWVPMVRRAVVAVLTAWELNPGAREEVELIVGELAANAAQYGGGELTLYMSWAYGGELLEVALADSGPAAEPRSSRECDPCERGRGLGIVKHLAEWVQVDQGPDCHVVTAAIRAAGTALSPAVTAQSHAGVADRPTPYPALTAVPCIEPAVTDIA
ncbi:ATP-binding protein [Streptomyces cacaoi]|uniref:ATP-binding protein n=1 Tax=Streptomyces cacaoi TaxID=1898 RepID=UPI003747995B